MAKNRGSINYMTKEQAEKFVNNLNSKQLKDLAKAFACGDDFDTTCKRIGLLEFPTCLPEYLEKLKQFLKEPRCMVEIEKFVGQTKSTAAAHLSRLRRATHVIVNFKYGKTKYCTGK